MTIHRYAICVFLFLTAAPALAAPQWSGTFGSQPDLRQWGAVHCGGQDPGSCPCEPSHNAGSCDTSPATASPVYQQANSRFFIVSPWQFDVTLKHDDKWPPGNTIRNELVYSYDADYHEPTGHYTYYRAGAPDRYFAWSTKFDGVYANGSFHCDEAGDPGCQSNPWNTIWQLHHAGDTGSVPLSMSLRNSASAGQYKLIFLHQLSDGAPSDYELWREDPVDTTVWYNFVVHVSFAESSSGVVELWVSKSGSPASPNYGTDKKALGEAQGGCSNWAGADHTVCYTNTLYTGQYDYLKQGHYRRAGITDSTTIRQRPTVTGATFADVAYQTDNPPVSSLADAFSTSTIDSTKWDPPLQTNGTVTVGGGFLHLAPAANTTAKLYLQSSGYFSLRNSAAFVRVQAVSNNGTINNNFTILQDGQNSVWWMYEKGTMYAFRNVAGVQTQVGSLPYVPADHAWWRIRDDGTNVLWDTSADGTVWTQRFSVPESQVPFVTNIRVMFYTEEWGPMASPGEARFQNLNVVGSGGCNPGPCMAALSDTFAGSSIDAAKWDVPVPVNGAATEAGNLNLVPVAGSTNAQIWITSKGTYTLTGSYAQVKVPQVPGGGNVNTSLRLRLAGTPTMVLWNYEAGTLYAIKRINSVDTTLAAISYSTANHLWWRISENAGTVTWSTSPDGLSWTTQASAATATLGFSVSSLNLEFYLETYPPGSPSPGQAQYSSLN